MPIYEYECESCGDVMEHWQKLSDPPMTACPSCSGKVHKVISQTSFHLKGSGWYVTDYAGKKGGDKTVQKKDNTSSGPSSSCDSAKKDCKAASSDT